MKITKIEISNFKCFKEFEMEFPDSNGMYLLTGKNLEDLAGGTNGIGKSSLMSAITWCLYEKTEKGKKAASLRNYSAKGGYAVVLHIEKNGKSHRLVRTWNPNSLQLDNEDIKNEEAVEFFGLDYTQFLYTVYFPQTDKKIKSFIDLGASEKLAFLSNLFNLDKWVACSNKCKEKLDEVKSDLRIVAQSIQQFEQEREVCISSSVSLSNQSENWFTKRTQEIEKLNEQIKALEDSLETVEDDSTLSADLKALKAEESALELEKIELNNQIRELTSMVGEHKHVVSECSAQIDGIQKFENADCPECLQQVSSEHVLSVAEKLLSKAESSQEKLDEVNGIIADIRVLYTNKEIELRTLREEIREVQAKQASASEKRKAEQQKLKHIETFESQLASKEKETNPYLKQISDLESRVSVLSEKIESNSKALRDSEKSQSQYEFWQKRFPQLRLSILDEVVQELEVHFNQVLGTMGLVNWTITISTERQLKDETVKNELTMRLLKKGREIDFDDLSGGEAQRIRVCTNVGLSDLIKSRCGIQLDLLMMDEPCASLSQEGIEGLIDIMESLSQTQKVLIAEHRIFDVAKFDGVYSLIKGEDGNTTLKVGNESRQPDPIGEPVSARTQEQTRSHLQAVQT